MADDITKTKETAEPVSMEDNLEEAHEFIEEQEEKLTSNIFDADETDEQAGKDTPTAGKTDEETEAKTDQTVDEEALQYLLQLGFSHDKALKLIESGLHHDVLNTVVAIDDMYRSQGARTKPIQQESTDSNEEPVSSDDIELPEELMTDEYDSALRDGLLKIKEHYGKQIKQLKAKLDAIDNESAAYRQFLMQQQQAAVANAFDNLLATVVDRPDLFGTQDNLTNEAIDNRIRIANAMQEIVQGRLQTRRPVPKPEELVSLAFRMEFGDQLEESVRKGFEKRIQKRTPIYKPTHRNSASPTPDLAAILEREKEAFL